MNLKCYRCSEWPCVCPDGQTIIHGDCREVLPLADIDAFIFDPPYGISHESNYGASWENTQIAGDGDTATRDWILGWTAGRPWACFGTWKMPTPVEARSVLIWDKGPASGMGDLSFPWKASWEEIAIGGHGWEGRRDEGVIRGHTVVTWETKGRFHPHQKPDSLVAYLLSRLPTVALVCDPCMGSGTTLVACKQAAIRGIGIEIEERYCETASERLRQGVLDFDGDAA